MEKVNAPWLKNDTIDLRFYRFNYFCFALECSDPENVKILASGIVRDSVVTNAYKIIEQ